MSTPRHDHGLEAALAGVPKPFRERLVRAYLDLKKNFAENRHEAAGMAAGKLCEVVLRLLQHAVSGSYIAFGKKVDNLPAECRKIIEAAAPGVVEALRVVVPRALVFLFTMRNKRGIGHVGGDVEANGIDAATMSRVADWVVCELIRVYHKLSIEEAQEIVDAISIRSLPDVWEVGGKRRVLRPELKGKQQVLLLLYGDPSSAVPAEDLCAWVEYANPTLFRRDVLRPLHKARLVEYDVEAGLVYLSPLGAKEVEEKLLGGGTG
jgi:hypothetical protein